MVGRSLHDWIQAPRTVGFLALLGIFAGSFTWPGTRALAQFVLPDGLTVSPTGTAHLFSNETTYLFRDGHRKNYIAHLPREGVYFLRLPAGYRSVSVNGERYYTFAGVYYQKNL